MGDFLYDCIDCGSDSCPCELAETGDCLVCTRLAGGNTCDCEWRGVCVYNEFVQNGRKGKKRREEFEAEIISRHEYDFETVVFVLKVGRGFALRCSMPGSYVFLKAPEEDSFYNLPISVMKADADKGEITLAVKAIGAKSKKLAACGAEAGSDEGSGGADRVPKSVIVRGVFRNGILGVKSLIDIRGRVPSGKRLMIVTKGIGFAPAALLLDWIGGRSAADIYVDTDKVDEALIRDYMPTGICLVNCPVGSEAEAETADCAGGGAEDVGNKITLRLINLQNEFSFRGKNGNTSVLEEYGKGGYDTVVVLTSDYYINKLRESIKIDACSNNFHICCGDGLCGACGYTDENGRCFKMCKCAELFATKL